MQAVNLIALTCFAFLLLQAKSTIAAPTESNAANSTSIFQMIKNDYVVPYAKDTIEIITTSELWKYGKENTAVEMLSDTYDSVKRMLNPSEALSRFYESTVTIREFSNMYYDDHIKPVTSSATEWASSVWSSAAERYNKLFSF